MGRGQDDRGSLPGGKAATRAGGKGPAPPERGPRAGPWLLGPRAGSLLGPAPGSAPHDLSDFSGTFQGESRRTSVWAEGLMTAWRGARDKGRPTAREGTPGTPVVGPTASWVPRVPLPPFWLSHQNCPLNYRGIGDESRLPAASLPPALVLGVTAASPWPGPVLPTARGCRTRTAEYVPVPQPSGERGVGTGPRDSRAHSRGTVGGSGDRIIFLWWL